MAEEVYGSIGDQPVRFTNAASEVTLNKLLAMNAQMAKKMGIKTDYELKQIKKTEIELKKLAKATKDEYTLLTKSNNARKQEIDQIKEKQENDQKAAKSTESLTKNFNLLSRNLSGTIFALANISKSLSSMGNSISSATQILSHIPKFGGALSAALGAVAGAVEKTQKAFQQSASVGANFNGSFREMIDSASGAGLTFDQFSSIIQQSGANVALLGKGSEDGARQLARYVKQLRTINDGKLQGQLAALGFTAESITENFATYGASMAKIGRLQSMSTEELVYSTADYLKNLSAVSKLTGEDRKSLEKRQQDMMNDSQFRAMMLNQDKTTFNSVNLLLKGLPETTSKAVKEIAATGTAISDEAKALAIQNPELFQAAQRLHQSLQRRDIITEEEVSQMHRMAQERAKINTKDMHELSGFLGRLGDATQKQIAIDNMALAAQQTTLAAQKKAANETPPETEAAKILRTQQELAESSNNITKSLLSYTDKLLAVMDKFNMVVDEYIAPALEYFSTNLMALGGAILGVSVLAAGAELAASVAGGYLAGKVAAGTAGKVAGTAAGTAGTAAGTAGTAAGTAGKAAGTAGAASGMSSMLGTIAKFMFMGPGLKIMLAAGAIGAIWYLLKNDPGTRGMFQNEGERDLVQTRVDLETRIAEVLADKDNQFTQEQIDAAKALKEGNFKNSRGAITPQMIIRWQDALAKEIAKEGGGDSERIKKLKEALAPVQAALDTVYGATQPTAGVGGNMPAVQGSTTSGDLHSYDVDPAVMASLALQSTMHDVDGTFVESIETTQALLENVDKLTRETRNLTNETRNASSCELDYSSPQALFNSFAKLIIGGSPKVQPGTTTTAPMVQGTPVDPTMQGVIPTQGRVSSEYGMRPHPITGKQQFHQGIDIAAAAGTAVLAPEGGTARLKTEIDKATGKMKGYGKYIEIVNDQGEIIHRLAHLSEQMVKDGERVVAGQQIGKVGNTGDSTGPHLHWETLRGGRHYNPREFMANASAARQAGMAPTGTRPGEVTPRDSTGAVTPPATAAASAVSPVVGGGGTTPNQPGPGAPAAATSATTGANNQMETLNTNMGQLVALSTEAVRLMDQQLSAIKKLDPNLNG
jgi:murein DD-endopeptidase MepM/ murein hydrolase activator NlpD